MAPCLAVFFVAPTVSPISSCLSISPTILQLYGLLLAIVIPLALFSKAVGLYCGFGGSGCEKQPVSVIVMQTCYFYSVQY